MPRDTSRHGGTYMGLLRVTRLSLPCVSSRPVNLYPAWLGLSTWKTSWKRLSRRPPSKSFAMGGHSSTMSAILAKAVAIFASRTRKDGGGGGWGKYRTGGLERVMASGPRRKNKKGDGETSESFGNVAGTTGQK